ncbi:MAG: hypothetical protein O3A00_09735 [Planctomycetota bacterium]|nr:hypothetical protein [Planctomycetota bacterium]
MSNMMDMVQELRLRRWARENFQSVGQRDQSWNAIVLDEMAKIDVESTVAPAETQFLNDENSIARGRQFVPLMPMTALDVHEAHDIPAPNYTTSPNEIPVSAESQFGMMHEI